MALLEAEAAAAAAANGMENVAHDDLLAQIDTDETTDDILDETKLKRMILNFEKKIGKNQELRIKFPDDPSKFMSSEVELHDAIQVKSTSDKKHFKKSIRDQKYGISNILKVECQSLFENVAG